MPGTASSADVEAIKALAVPVGAPGDFTIHLRRLNRGFLLDDAFLPQPSFVQWSGDAVLTPGRPEALIWWAA